MKNSSIQDAIELRDPELAKEALSEIDMLLSTTRDSNEKVYLLFSKSSCYGILGDFDRAKEQLQLALQQQPDDPDTRLTFELNEALLWQQQGDYSQALEKFDTLLSRHRQNFNRPDLRFMYEDIQQRRAFLCVTLRKFKDAIPILKQILCFDLAKEVRSDALAELGLCCMELKDWVSARAYFLQAQEIGVSKEQEKTFHFYLGIALFYTDSPLEAEREFHICEEHAVEWGLPILDIYNWLAATCRLLGHITQAERYAQLARAT